MYHFFKCATQCWHKHLYANIRLVAIHCTGWHVHGHTKVMCVIDVCDASHCQGFTHFQHSAVEGTDI